MSHDIFRLSSLLYLYLNLAYQTTLPECFVQIDYYNISYIYIIDFTEIIIEKKLNLNTIRKQQRHPQILD